MDSINETAPKKSFFGDMETRTKILSVAFLMATTSVGPGFLTQNSMFTSLFKHDMAFPVAVAMVFTIGIVLNLWRIVGVSQTRIQDIANKVAPGLGYVIGCLLALGAVAFNLGNVSGSALGINVLTGIDTTFGSIITGALGVTLFLAHNAAKHMDRMARYLGLLMILLIAYVALTSMPALGPVAQAVVSPSVSYDSLLLPTLTIVGGAVGGYYTGAQRLVDNGLSGQNNVSEINKAAGCGISFAVIIQFMLFMAVLGVVASGIVLDKGNPAASAFRHGAGDVGYYIFGFVLFFASITSVIGNSYMAISLTKTLFPIIGNNEKNWIIGFIIATTAGTVFLGKPVILLMTAGLVNSLILPVVLGTMLIASRRKDIVGDYKHPAWLFSLGALIVVVMGFGGITNVGRFFSTFLG